MDTIRDSKQKRNEKGHGSAKPSHDNTIEPAMADDLKDLPEFDENNPEMKAWMEKEEARQKQSLATTTREDAIAFVDQLLAKQRSTSSEP